MNCFEIIHSDLSAFIDLPIYLNMSFYTKKIMLKSQKAWNELEDNAFFSNKIFKWNWRNATLWKNLLMRNIDCYNLFAWNESWFWDLYWIFPALPDISRLFINSSREQNGMVMGPDTVVLSCLGEVRTGEHGSWSI